MDTTNLDKIELPPRVATYVAQRQCTSQCPSISYQYGGSRVQCELCVGCSEFLGMKNYNIAVFDE